MALTSAHAAETDLRQIEVYRRMSPEERLVQAMAMNRQMRDLMEAGLQSTHPHLTSVQRRQEIARRIRHARS